MLSVCIHKCTHTHIFIVDQLKEKKEKSELNSSQHVMNIFS